MITRPLRGRIAHVAAGVVALAVAGLCVYETSMIGFPDGYVSDYHGARRIGLVGYALVSAVAGLWFGFLGLRARGPSRAKWIASYVTYGLVLAVALLVDCLAYTWLDHGQGG